MINSGRAQPPVALVGCSDSGSQDLLSAVSTKPDSGIPNLDSNPNLKFELTVAY